MKKQIEPGIVWLKDQLEFPYLREQLFLCERRNGLPPSIGRVT